MNFLLMNNRVYWVLMLILATGVATAKQAYERHERYFALSAAKNTMRTLKTEEQRLLIEQQTFSATPHIAQRSVSELGMFFPTDNEKLIITP
ncbi:MAG: cell division protein FtsL [Moraxella sp.]|nr:cell division protein FtsL [Moraxella sp.]